MRGGGTFRDPDQANIDMCILKLGGNFETGEKRKVLGTISIHVDDLLIPGSSEYVGYISWEMQENPR